MNNESTAVRVNRDTLKALHEIKHIMREESIDATITRLLERELEKGGVEHGN